MDNLINKAQDFFKTDIRYLLSGGFWLILFQAASALSSLALAFAFAHLSSKTIYGEYKYFLSITNILTALTLSAIGVAITKAVAEGKDGVIYSAFWTNIKISPLLLIVATCGSFYYALHANLSLSLAFIFAGLFLPLYISASLFDPFLIGKKDFKTNSIFNILNTILPVAIIIAALFYVHTSISIFAVYVIANLIFALVFYVLTIKKYHPRKDSSVSVLTYGTHLSIINIINIIIDNIDQLLVFHYLGAAQLAIYAFSVAMPEQLKGVFKNVATLALPKFSERNLEDIQSSLFKKMLQFIFIISLGIIVYIIAAPYLFKYLFPQYIDSVLYSQIFSISIIAIAATIPVSVMYAKESTKELYIYNFATSIIQVILLVILIPFYGIWGALIARIIARTINLVVSIIMGLQLRNKHTIVT